MSSSSTNTLGKYQIIREIARSNDVVYEAIDPSINRRIALKELSVPPNLTGAQKRERIERFLREGRAAGKLAHPNIVTVYEVGKENDRFFIAMEYLEGQTLRDVLQAGGALSIRDAVNYASQLCSALSYAHANGIIHRDIKPDNVQILPGGHVKLTDFGIARMMGESSITQDGQVFGTPSYMSPEQVAGKPLDARSDIFSTGVMLYEMITGKKPFTGDSVVTITYNIVNMEPPAPPGAPPFLVGIIRKAMAKDVNMRYSSVDEMAEDLREEKCGNSFLLNSHVTGSWPQIGNQSAPGPFQQPPASQQPIPPLTPYGTPMPSPGAGGPVNPSPDPFAQNRPMPAPVSMPAPSPSQPMLSSETRNFLGIFLLTIAFTGMLVFAVWAVRLAFTGFQTKMTSGPAAEAYQRGSQAYDRGDMDTAIREWNSAANISPSSTAADNARNRLYALRVQKASDAMNARDYVSMDMYAKTLIETGPERPEGFYFRAAAFDNRGEVASAKENYLKAIQYGKNDVYGQAARQRVGRIFLEEGNQMFATGQAEQAAAAYDNARYYGDAAAIDEAEQKLASMKYGGRR